MCGLVDLGELVHAFVDESTRRRYILCSIAVNPRDLGASRRELRAMLLPGQRRLHFVHEASSRRKALLSQMSDMRVRGTIYVCSGDDTAARKEGLGQLVRDLVSIGGRRLVVESREGRDGQDRQTIRAALLATGAKDQLDYKHMRPSEEPLLWVADAIAWAAGADRAWRRRTEEIVDTVRRVGS